MTLAQLASTLALISLSATGANGLQQGQRSDTVVRVAGPPRFPVSRLVPEITIGVVNGPDEYMFDSIRDILLAKDGNIWVTNVSRAPGGPVSVKVYDASGRFVRRVGRHGQGPGEYTTPAGLAQLPDGRVLLRDVRGNKILVYTAAGEPSATWTFPTTHMWFVGGTGGIFADTAGIAYMPFRVRPQTANEGVAFVRLRSNGAIIDTIATPDLPRSTESFVSVSVQAPNGPGYTQHYTAESAAIWSPLGYMLTFVPQRNTFEMRIPPARASGTKPATWMPGDPVTSVKLADRRINLSADEQRDLNAFLRSQHARYVANSSPGSFPVDPPVAPRVKPPYRNATVRSDGRIWLNVPMPSERYQLRTYAGLGGSPLTNFNWREETAYDIYEPDGSYFTRLVLPHGIHVNKASGDIVWCVILDQDYVPTLRRYRIVH